MLATALDSKTLEQYTANSDRASLKHLELQALVSIPLGQEQQVLASTNSTLNHLSVG